MASTSTARDEGLGYLEEFIRAVQATRERLESHEDLDAVEGSLEAGEELQEGVEGMADIAASMVEYVVEKETARVDLALERARENLARMERCLKEMTDALAGEKDAWDRQEAEGTEQLEEHCDRIAGQLGEATEALADLREAVIGLQSGWMVQDETLQEQVAAMGERLLEQVLARIAALEGPLDDQQAAADKAEQASECKVVQSIVMVVVAVIVTVIAVVAVIFTGGVAAAVLVAAIAAVVAAVATLAVTVVLNVEPLAKGAAVILKVMGFSEASERLVEATSDAAAMMSAIEPLALLLAPLLIQVAVVAILANSIQSVLSALNPFD